MLSKKITLTNQGQETYQLDKLALTIPLPYRAKELESYSGRWSREFQSHRQTLEHGLFSQENRRGRTSHEYFPGCLLGSANFAQQIGEVWGFHLGWSGNHFWRAEAKSDGRRFVQSGELLMPGEVSLIVDRATKHLPCMQVTAIKASTVSDKLTIAMCDNIYFSLNQIKCGLFISTLGKGYILTMTLTISARWQPRPRILVLRDSS
ncbi:alpha-galactosidase [Vibrio ishigakensis]|uniref:Alpha-galactosidase n=1 Tax=Vibrio ishigakensis TaxID=1481914 RepID=A0A0B8PPF4_9VIBR|nr:alpha-galactosidase [Vibrio ishigakensis]